MRPLAPPGASIQEAPNQVPAALSIYGLRHRSERHARQESRHLKHPIIKTIKPSQLRNEHLIIYKLHPTYARRMPHMGIKPHEYGR